MKLTRQELDSNPNSLVLSNARTGELIGYSTIRVRHRERDFRERDSGERDNGEKDIWKRDIRERAIGETIATC
jgi:hypothetical protein